ncbi:hypothetical protein SLEP1_g37139 [Rubroshorea leprosula]|uniref:Uncharacterized protein n=1 Tax=Rubroshorea leprosula TaxID=152421 RepID=A0AAV5KTM5_9ROSI|nr:hypothetical protein SLEP1_g37139 [Rubroshorea leprosula]
MDIGFLTLCGFESRFLHPRRCPCWARLGFPLLLQIPSVFRLSFLSLSIAFSDFNFQIPRMFAVFFSYPISSSKSSTNLLFKIIHLAVRSFYFLQIYSKRVALALKVNGYLNFGDISAKVLKLGFGRPAYSSNFIKL